MVPPHGDWMDPGFRAGGRDPRTAPENSVSLFELPPRQAGCRFCWVLNFTLALPLWPGLLPHHSKAQLSVGLLRFSPQSLRYVLAFSLLVAALE